MTGLVFAVMVFNIPRIWEIFGNTRLLRQVHFFIQSEKFVKQTFRILDSDGKRQRFAALYKMVV